MKGTEAVYLEENKGKEVLNSTVTFCYFQFPSTLSSYYPLLIVKLESERSVCFYRRFSGQLITNAVSDLQAYCLPWRDALYHILRELQP